MTIAALALGCSPPRAPTPRPAPLSPPQTASQPQLAAGGRTTCVLKARRPLCWGDNSGGEAGLPPVSESPEGDFVASPTEVEGAPDLVALYAGASAFCGISIEQDLWCWGRIAAEFDRWLPRRLPLTHVRGVAMGSQHVCGLLSSGAVWCLGYGGANITGVAGPAKVHAEPVRLVGLDQPDDLFAMQGLTCGTFSGVVRCLPATLLSMPVTLGDRIVRSRMGGDHACALLETGRVRCWGDEREGRLGRIKPSARWNELPLENLTALTVGRNHTCALREDGAVWCWGANQFGQMGDGIIADITDRTGHPDPVQVPLGHAREVAAGSEHTCALLEDGSVSCWGDNQLGQCGTGANEPRIRAKPVQAISAQ